MVVTPESFSELPEYAATASPTSRRQSVQSQVSGFGTPKPNLYRPPVSADPTVVILGRFEDISPSSAGPFSIPSPGRRSSLPDGMQYLAISTAAPQPSMLLQSSPGQVARPDDNFVIRFRHYIVRRLTQPQLEISSLDSIAHGSTRDAFEIEAARFEPLRHAICAISALNLSYNGRSSLEQGEYTGPESV